MPLTLGKFMNNCNCNTRKSNQRVDDAMILLKFQAVKLLKEHKLIVFYDLLSALTAIKHATDNQSVMNKAYDLLLVSTH